MTLRLLAYAPYGQEFTVAAEINDMGALAVVPRRVDLVRLPKQRRPQIVEEPFLRGYMFCAMSPDQWHEAPKEMQTVKYIGPREWERVQDFAARIEQDYQHRMAQIEAGNRLSEYNPGDALEILGGVMQGYMAKFLRLREGVVPMIEAEVQLTLMGKPVMAQIDPVMARRVG
jgi:transcription antitermination factor NusG